MSTATAISPGGLLRTLERSSSEFADQPGFYLDMPENVYQSDPVPGGSVSASAMKVLIDGCPADYRWLMDHRSVSTEAMEFGSLFHAEVLGTPLDHEIVDMATTRNKVSDEVRSRGIVPVTEAMLVQAAAMAKSIWEHDDAAELLAAAPYREVSMFSAHPATGLRLRGRADALGELNSRPLIVDLKTVAGGVSPAEIAKEIGSRNYHVQNAHYSSMVANLLGLGDGGYREVDFAFIFVSKTEPYRVAVARLDQPTMLQGISEVSGALATIAECQRTGVWPGWGSFTVGLPAWRRR